MGGEKSEGGGSIFGNPNTFLAILTIAGGLWLVSQKLSSDRPVSPSGASRQFLGAQKLEARLWEDPFKPVVEGSDRVAFGKASEVAIEIGALVDQISRHTDSGRVPAKGVLLFPAFLAGGQYSEDQESRIRSRYAIVSALGQAGYAPEDAEHIGVLRVPWLKDDEMEKALRSSQYEVSRLWSTDASMRLLGIQLDKNSSHIEVRYEWYRRRDFAQGSTAPDDKAWSWVLVLWLDESCFEDEPLVRLALLLDPLLEAKKNDRPGVAMLGPRHSSTLRAMIKDRRKAEPLLSYVVNKKLAALVGGALHQVDVYCATPSVMDEVLVENADATDDLPRASIRDKLTEAARPEGERRGFKSFHNFAATDAQLAGEIFDELRLRNANPAVLAAPDAKDARKRTNHVVLISEWDTFYGRMLSLTYGAELARLQAKEKNGKQITRAEFVSEFVAHDQSYFPENLHRFTYFRGLDGQTVGAESKRESGDSSGNTAPSAEDPRGWAPNVNKAEGQAQFDYLGRLADRIDELQAKLTGEGEGQIKAIGIVGSDVYDTLLILQALRKRFPALLFFTTDLDVRFLHPLERPWARNLLIVSGFGLSLDPSLQGTVPPFRDSTQTAQFAAVLAALGNDELKEIGTIPPRRFEIGSATVVDLSTSTFDSTFSKERKRILHPPTERESYETSKSVLEENKFYLAVMATLLLAGAVWRCRPLQRVTWKAFEYPTEVLDYSEEDVGGPDGADLLIERMVQLKQEWARWLAERPQVVEIRGKLAVLSASSKEDDVSMWEREKLLKEQVSALVGNLNLLLSDIVKKERDERISLIAKEMKEAARERSAALLGLFPPARRMLDRYFARKSLDAVLESVSTGGQQARIVRPSETDPGFVPKMAARVWAKIPKVGRVLDVVLGSLQSTKAAVDESKMADALAALHAAIFARDTARKMYFLRCRRLVCFWLSALAIAWATLWMANRIWEDTFIRPDGEPFSLTSGTSAWPAEIVRLVVVALAVCCSVGLSLKLHAAYLSLTRQFRFSPPSKQDGEYLDKVCAQQIWHDYYKHGSFRRSWYWLVGVMVLYYYLLLAIYKLSGEASLTPMRGETNFVLNMNLSLAAFFGFLLLAFLTVGAAHRCREFIERLSAHPTVYPRATRCHFSRQMGRISDEYLDEWIDLQLIAELTEQVGRLVYYPAGLLTLMLLARNNWWDCWSWTSSLFVIFGLNFTLALASVVIVQRAAKEAKHKAEQSLTAKIRMLQAQVAPTRAENDSSQAQVLLKEINELHRGAFVPFWENPVVGAIFLSSGGTTLIQFVLWFLAR